MRSTSDIMGDALAILIVKFFLAMMAILIAYIAIAFGIFYAPNYVLRVICGVIWTTITLTLTLLYCCTRE